MNENVTESASENGVKSFGQSIFSTKFDSESGDSVSQIKQKGAELIDLIVSLPCGERRMNEAINNIEAGVMFAVKGLIV
jgi:hypothetical protein